MTPGTVLYACTPDDDAAVHAAREWIKRRNLTKDDATLGRKDGSVIVVAKREVDIHGDGRD